MLTSLQKGGMVRPTEVLLQKMLTKNQQRYVKEAVNFHRSLIWAFIAQDNQISHKIVSVDSECRLT